MVTEQLLIYQVTADICNKKKNQIKNTVMFTFNSL